MRYAHFPHDRISLLEIAAPVRPHRPGHRLSLAYAQHLVQAEHAADDVVNLQTIDNHWKYRAFLPKIGTVPISILVL